MTSDDLKGAFSVYTQELERCLASGAYWAALHLLLPIPDICSSLENEKQPVGERYVQWCEGHFEGTKLTGGDRYQIRCAVLHSGTTLPANLGKTPAHQTTYRSFSFVDPSIGISVHQEISTDGTNITLDIVEMAKETEHALSKWSVAVAADPKRRETVLKNLHTVVRVQQKEMESVLVTEDGDRIVTEHGDAIVVSQRFRTTSST